MGVTKRYSPAEVADAFGKLLAHAMPRPVLPQFQMSAEVAAELAAMTDAQVKALWDDPEGDWHDHVCDDVWMELNRRGLGDYCTI